MENVLKIKKIDSIKNGIRIMLDTAQCVYFYKFGKTIYTELEDNLQKKTFKDFKQDILKTNWDVEKLKKNWIENGK